MWSGPGEEDGVNIQEVTSEGCTMPSTAEDFHEYIELPMQSAPRVLEFVFGDHRYEVLGSALLKSCLMEFKNDGVAPDTRAYLSTMLQQSPTSFMLLTKYLDASLN